MNYLGASSARHSRDVGFPDQKLSAFNRVHGCPYVIDTYSTNYAFNLIDSNDGTRWTSASWMGSLPWCMLDLGAPRTVAKVRLLEDGTAYATQNKFECSDDNVNWALVHTTPSGRTGGEYLWYPPCLRYRYWRAKVVAATWVYGWNVYAFELWGLAA